MCMCCFFILDIIGVVAYVSKIKKKGLCVKQPYVHVVLMNHMYVCLCTCNFFRCLIILNVLTVSGKNTS
jgi:hypothetical protein